MSFPELLDAVKALPRLETVELLNALTEEIGGGSQLTPEEIDYLKQFEFSGVAHAGWRVTTDEAGFRAIEAVLAEIKAKK